MAYFQSYEDLEVHRSMLEDTVRLQCYKKAIDDNRDAFVGKTVLDVGAGTGILSIFCAQAGARKVYAVEASDIYRIAQRVVHDNGFDGVIDVIHGSVESIHLPDDRTNENENGRVDIIVSEWMGHYLLHEGMLDSVIAARDRFLRPGGLMFPENATLYSVPCSVNSLHDNWLDVCGVRMNSFGEQLRHAAGTSPKIMRVTPAQVLGDPEILLWADLREITVAELNCTRLRHIAVADKVGKYQGICLWFTCAFPASVTEPVILSTDCEEPQTHWQQTVVVLPCSVDVEEGTPIPYEITLRRSAESNRKYGIEVEMLNGEVVEHPEYCNCHMTKCILSKAVLQKYEDQCFSKEVLHE